MWIGLLFLLDQVPANAARGEPALVLAEVDRHRRQFPRGRLAEERAALAIRALLALGFLRSSGFVAQGTAPATALGRGNRHGALLPFGGLRNQRDTAGTHAKRRPRVQTQFKVPVLGSAAGERRRHL
jgi:hypothetical protein